MLRTFYFEKSQAHTKAEKSTMHSIFSTYIQHFLIFAIFVWSLSHLRKLSPLIMHSIKKYYTWKLLWKILCSVWLWSQFDTQLDSFISVLFQFLVHCWEFHQYLMNKRINICDAKFWYSKSIVTTVFETKMIALEKNMAKKKIRRKNSNRVKLSQQEQWLQLLQLFWLNSML